MDTESKLLAPGGYEIYNAEYLVDSQTGEAVQYLPMAVPLGSRIFTPEQQASRKRHAEYDASRRREQRERFFFLNCNRDLKKLHPATAARLVYLLTYTGYHSRVLMKTERTPMTVDALPGILGLSSRYSYDFWKEVCPDYLSINRSGQIEVTEGFFARGRLARKQYTHYQQIYDQGIRRLYHSIAKRQHRYLGYVFYMLQYISIEYNILCYNPFETDLQRVVPMPLSDFCHIIGFDKSHIDRLRRVYSSLKFDVEGSMKRLCAFVSNGNNSSDSQIVINPAILYAGRNYNRVEITELYFK